MTRPLLRMADANLNRAMEGLRVAEDVLRFVRRSAPLSAEARRLRHALARAGGALGARSALLAARDAAGDPGRGRSGAGPRHSARDLLAANLRRAQEAVRVLEEVCRAGARPAGAREFQRVRYALYRLESRARS